MEGVHANDEDSSTHLREERLEKSAGKRAQSVGADGLLSPCRCSLSATRVRQEHTGPSVADNCPRLQLPSSAHLAGAEMPHVVGASARVVDHEGLTIDELAGNVATKSDDISVAHVKVAKPTSEPWLTLHYKEWISVLKGKMVLLHGAGGKLKLEVKEGETVFIDKGERFRPTFPKAGTECTLQSRTRTLNHGLT